MKTADCRNKYIIEIISLLFVLLFLYAAVSKILDFENFQVQLGQSPLLSAFANPVSYLIPAIEVGICIFLGLPKYRIIGLWGALCLMTMFTIYIYTVLHFSSFVPCSCGGILEKMSWNVHLVFNLFFVALAIVGIILKFRDSKLNNYESQNKKTAVKLTAAIFCSASFIVILFLCSEEIMHYDNPFLRRYIRRSVKLVQTKDLKFNSFYFAGTDKNRIYLGNYTAPLYLLSFNDTLANEKRIIIDFKNNKHPFSRVRILIDENQFYLMDGSVPCLYKGDKGSWKITSMFTDVPRFTTAIPIDDASFFFRNNSGPNSANILGNYNEKGEVKIKYFPNLLQSQYDGIFDTDGILEYDKTTGRIAFVYYYRNEFFTVDHDGENIQRSHTIDTTSKAKIKVAYLKEGKNRKMAAPPLIVNSLSTVHNNLLFVESKIKGQYENEDMWKHAAIIDVYSLKSKSYLLSFPVFGTEEDKLNSMRATQDFLYVIIGTKLMVYRFQNNLKSAIETRAKTK